jgi:anti-sigma B factor antagonist
MPQDPLVIEDIPGPKDGQRILRLIGPLTMSNLFDFQSKVRTNTSRVLLLDFTGVPYVDSAGIGALVGAYVTHNKEGRGLYMIGVNERVMNALKVTHVEKFFHFVESLSAAEQAINA